MSYTRFQPDNSMDLTGVSPAGQEVVSATQQQNTIYVSDPANESVK